MTDPISLGCAILTVSDTRTAGDDTSGNLLAESVAHAGHVCLKRDIVPCNLYQIRRVMSDWIADPDVHVILTTGATGFAPEDCMPEAVAPLFDKEIAGFGELFRHLSHGEIGTSTLQSRAVAGYANDTAIFCMPGSTHACRTAWTQIIRDQLDSECKPCNFATLLHRRPTAA